MQPIRILIADDHPVIRRYVRAALEEQSWEVCGEAANGREAVTLATEHRPDVAVLDLSMPELDGIEAAREIHQRCPQTEMIILTMHDAPELLQAAFASGVRACIQKNDVQDLVVAVRQALQSGEPRPAEL